MTGLFTQNTVFRRITILILLLMGMGIRLLDLTDPPLDIHPTRQLHSALMARGMYYQVSTERIEDWKVKTAVQQWKREAVIEPPVMENLTAYLYRIAGREHLWIPRILSSLFWVLGGLAIYMLAASLTNADGGITALIFYLFQVYGVMASRSFQPDPLMVGLLCYAWWAFLRYIQNPGWKWAILAGVFSGAAIYIKNVSVFFIALPFIVLLIRKDLRLIIKDTKVWLIAALSILPAILYIIYGTFIAGYLGQQFSFRIFPNLWVDISNYSRWMGQIKDTAGIPSLALGFLGLFLFSRSESRKMVFGLWAGYLVYGFTFAYHIGTHDYYQLPFIPVLALSIAPIGMFLSEKIIHLHPWRYTRQFLSSGILVLVLLLFWNNRNILLSQDYRQEPAFWQALGDRLRFESVIGLTQDYGYRSAYYGWKNIQNWPGSGDFEVRELAGRPKKDVQAMFEKEFDGKSYFLVTWLEDYERQAELKQYLETNFSVETSDGYLLYNLTEPNNP